MHRYQLTIIAPHLVQYHAPLYRALATSDRIDVRVLYLDTTGMSGRMDASMGATLRWGPDLLEGYPHTFLRNWSPTFGKGACLGRINPSLVPRLLFGSNDAILVQGYQSLSNWLSLLSVQPRRTRVLFRGEGALRADKKGTKELVKRAILGAVFRLSDGVLYTVPKNRDYLLHYGCPDGKLYPLPCAVDNAFFRSRWLRLREQRPAIRRDLGLPEHLVVGVFAGRMAGLKRQEHLLQATVALQGRGIDLGVVLAGDGPERKNLESLVREHALPYVRFVGFQTREDMCRIYATADIFVLCSEYDPSPKVLNEALNFALPMVISDRVGQIGDSAVSGENAFVYPYGDIEKLTNGLEALIRDGGKRGAMGARSLALADEFSLATDVRCMEQAVEAVCDAR